MMQKPSQKNWTEARALETSVTKDGPVKSEAPEAAGVEDHPEAKRVEAPSHGTQPKSAGLKKIGSTQ